MKARYYIVILTVLCLHSCCLYKPYQSPSPLGETEGAVPHWRTVFTDPCLQALIDSTLRNNRDETVARLNIQQAQVAYKAARLGYLPTLSFDSNAGYYHYGKDINYLLGGHSYRLGISATWQLDVFGASITNTKRQSKANREYMQYYQQAVDCQLISAMAQLYYLLLTQEKQLQIQRDMKVLYEKTYESTQSLYQAGQYTSAAVSEAKAQLENLISSNIELEYDIEQTKKGICQLMDVKPYDFKFGTLDNVPLPSFATNGVPFDLLQNRPDLRAAQKQVEMAYYEVQLSKGAFYPSINITADGGWMTPTMWFANTLGSLSQPLFQAGKLTARLKTAKLQQEVAVTNFERKALDAYYEVVYALDQSKLAKDKREHLHAEVASLQESVDATQELMNQGTATYLEVLIAMKQLLTARTTEVANQYTSAQALVSLYGALGGR